MVPMSGAFEENNRLGCENFAENPCAVGGAAAAIVALVVLAVASIGAVPPLHYGIKYNYFNKQADIVNVYGPGRFLIGPMTGFLLFPQNIQSVEFSGGLGLVQFGARYPALHTRTQDGLALHLQASLQYKLRKSDVGLLYKEFSMDYENFFIGQTRNVLTTVAANYVGTEFWTKRRELGMMMEKAVNVTLAKTYAECWGLQILDISLPSDFNDAIVQTQVNAQMISTQSMKQASTMVRAETDVIEASFGRKVRQITASGQANYTYIVKAADAEAKNQTVFTEVLVTNEVKRRLKLGPADLIEYQEYLALVMMENASVLYGFSEGSGLLMDKTPKAPPSRPAPAPPAPHKGRSLSAMSESDAEVQAPAHSTWDEL